MNVTARQIGSRASGQVPREGQASFDRSMMIESGPGHDWPTCTPKGHVGSGRTRRDSRLFSPLKVLPPTCGYCASLCAACDQIGPSSGYDVQPSLKKARTIWHLESGDDSPNLGVAVVNKTGTDCLSHSQQAPVQQGEQEVRAILGRRSARQDLEGPFGRQQSAPRPTSKLVSRSLRH